VWNEILEHANWVVPLLILSAVVVAWKPIWKSVVCPVGRMTSWVVHFKDAWPVLESIAEEFKPNHGTSLRDVVDRLADDHKKDHHILIEQSVALHNIEQQLERILTDD
jgi:hypothetical protein